MRRPRFRRKLKNFFLVGIFLICIPMVFDYVRKIVKRNTFDHRIIDSTQRLLREIASKTTEQTPKESDVYNDDMHEYNHDKPLPYEALHDTFFNVNHRQAMLYGNFRPYKSYLTIGIPTIKRKGVNYLDETVSVLNTSTPEPDKKDVVIVIFFTDKDHVWITNESRRIYNMYTKEVNSGFIQLVHPHHNAYPNFTKLQRTFQDSRERVAWRSKQNLDFSYLMTYSRNLSQYYMQIEDDVKTKYDYVRIMKTYLSKQKEKWFVISFSTLGFIGKLFKSTDLPTLATFLLMFFDRKPCDWLLVDVMVLKGQGKFIVVTPSLFQHMGKISSLHDKKQMLVDRTFLGTNLKKFKHKNPPASIESDMITYENFIPVNAYNSTDSVFWAKNPISGSYYRIVLYSPQNISRIVISTGTETVPDDIIQHAGVIVSVRDSGTHVRCGRETSIGKLNNGFFDTQNMTISFPFNIDCVSIELAQNNTVWAIVNEISIFTS